MNKKLLTLAVAAALAVPAVASAEAIMYGKLNVSLDYENIDNVIQPVYNNSAFGPFSYQGTTLSYPGEDIFVGPTGAISPFRVAPGTVLTREQAQAVQGLVRVGPGQVLPGTDFKGWGMSRNTNFQGEGRASRLGVKGSEDLGGGLKAIYQVEIGVNTNDTNQNVVNGNDQFYWRNTFIGLAGDWGTVLMGRHDTPMKLSTARLDLFSDTMADYNGTIGFQDLRADNAIAYISPSWSGFQLALATVPAGMATAGYGQNINSDQINGAYSIAATYKNGPFFGSLAYESINEEMYMGSGTSLNGCFSQVEDYSAFGFGTVTTYDCAKPDGDFNKWRFGLGLLDWNGFSLTAIYENQTSLPTSVSSVVYSNPQAWLQEGYAGYNLLSGPEDRELWQIQAGYAFGNFMVKGMYGESSFSGNPTLPNWGAIGQTTGNAAVYNSIANDLYDGKTSSWALGVDYNFSKRTSVYALYTSTESDTGATPVLSDGVPGLPNAATTIPSGRSQWDGFSFGMMHSF